MPCDSSRCVRRESLSYTVRADGYHPLRKKEKKLYRSSRGLTLLARQYESVSLYNELSIACYCIMKFQGFASEKYSRCNLFLYSPFFFSNKHGISHTCHKISKLVLSIDTNLRAHLTEISLWVWKILLLSCRSNGI